MSLQDSFVLCITDKDLKFMVNTLPPNRVAEVYITYYGVFNLVNPNVGSSKNVGMRTAGTGQHGKELKGSGKNVHKLAKEVKAKGKVSSKTLTKGKLKDKSSVSIEDKRQSDNEGEINTVGDDDEDGELFDEYMLLESERNGSDDNSFENFSYTEDAGNDDNIGTVRTPKEERTKLNDSDLIIVEGMQSEYESSSNDLKSLSGSDKETKRKKYPVFNKRTDLKNPKFSLGLRFQVSCIYRDGVAVVLLSRTCSCRKWELRGIPCNHAVACIFRSRARPGSYVDDFYSIETYMRSYGQPYSQLNYPTKAREIELEAVENQVQEKVEVPPSAGDEGATTDVVEVPPSAGDKGAITDTVEVPPTLMMNE
ncbi:hypothetical protein ACH5RR_016727 [Cinchona calisaya]|uniref:SWIM-type domain-containing protein n=1 Tax=Cinchona calisaya TaxID=153742 RepID=A0ABD2ZWM9_9GENT